MNKIKMIIVSVFCLLLLTGCTITTNKETADNFGGVLEWLGFERCETENCE